MQKLDRLIYRAKKQAEPKGEELYTRDNPYLQMSYESLVRLMDGQNYSAPERHSFAWKQYMYALMHAEISGGGLIE